MKLILAFDNDKAGQMATQRAFKIIQDFNRGNRHIRHPVVEILGYGYIGKSHLWTYDEFEEIERIKNEYKPLIITQNIINETFLDLKEVPMEGRISDRDIQRAKEVPIDTLIEFKNNLALCLWHNEKNSSMRFYSDTNRVWCFSCSNGGDSIDFIMKLKDFSFNEAVLYLCQKKK